MQYTDHMMSLFVFQPKHSYSGFINLSQLWRTSAYAVVVKIFSVLVSFLFFLSDIVEPNPMYSITLMRLLCTHCLWWMCVPVNCATLAVGPHKRHINVILVSHFFILQLLTILPEPANGGYHTPLCEVWRKIRFQIYDDIIIAQFHQLISSKRTSNVECLCFGSLCPAQIMKQTYDDLNHWNRLSGSIKGRVRRNSISQPQPNFLENDFSTSR